MPTATTDAAIDPPVVAGSPMVDSTPAGGMSAAELANYWAAFLPPIEDLVHEWEEELAYLADS